MLLSAPELQTTWEHWYSQRGEAWRDVHVGGIRKVSRGHGTQQKTQDPAEMLPCLTHARRFSEQNRAHRSHKKSTNEIPNAFPDS